jgi:hypothetical protein
MADGYGYNEPPPPGTVPPPPPPPPPKSGAAPARAGGMDRDWARGALKLLDAGLRNADDLAALRVYVRRAAGMLARDDAMAAEFKEFAP